MKLKKGKIYQFVISLNRQDLHFTGKIIEIENNFITFIDKFGEELNYNLNNISSFKEETNQNIISKFEVLSND